MLDRKTNMTDSALDRFIDKLPPPPDVPPDIPPLRELKRLQQEPPPLPVEGVEYNNFTTAPRYIDVGPPSPPPKPTVPPPGFDDVKHAMEEADRTFQEAKEKYEAAVQRNQPQQPQPRRRRSRIGQVFRRISAGATPARRRSGQQQAPPPPQPSSRRRSSTVTRPPVYESCVCSPSSDSRISRLSRVDTDKIGDQLKINFAVIKSMDWNEAVNTEVEYLHLITPRVSNLMAAKMVLRNIDRYPDYYKRLRRMHSEADAFWERRKRPSHRLVQ